tara:strand:+ start:1109 stop:1309 length:201 start_codon:yes stop_codon:yes gene_type:complete
MAHFISTLSFEELRMLREAVRRVHMAEYREDHITTDEMDRIIEQIGPETREKMIKFMVDKGQHIND